MDVDDTTIAYIGVKATSVGSGYSVEYIHFITVKAVYSGSVHDAFNDWMECELKSMHIYPNSMDTIYAGW